MKTLKTIMLAGLLSSLAVAQATAQFSSGSDGSYGPLIITNDTTLMVESNGIYNCTTIYVAPNVTLKFLKNEAAGNFPVHLLATSNVLVEGTISVSGQDGSGYSGQGGPGGFDGGEGGIAPSGVLPGDGLGPGGGKADSGAAQDAGRGVMVSWAGSGSCASAGSPPSGTNVSAIINGNRLVMPLLGGSGGGGCIGSAGRGGGGGGGAILIASSTSVTVNGQILARGGEAARADYEVVHLSGNGSGGAIRIVAPQVAGSGSLNVSGGTHNEGQPGFWGMTISGGAGWIRIDTLYRTQIGFTFNGVYSIGSFMQVFPSPLATLSIVQAAGTNIVEGQTAPVSIILPYGSSTNQTVTVRARDFKGYVPISVVLTPENGPSSKYDDVINMGSTNVAEKIVSVVMPVNTLTRIHAWTR